MCRRRPLRGVAHQPLIPPPAPAVTQMTSIREVEIGVCQLIGTTLTVPVRAIQHRTGRHATPGSIALNSIHLNLQADLALPNGATSSNLRPSQTTDATGLTTFTFTVPAVAHIKLKAWMDQTGTPTAPFHENKVAWASHDVSSGAVVTLSTQPDIADDKNLALQKRAKFIVKRTGATAASLTVGFTRPSGLVAPKSGKDLIATYGTTAPNDYYLSVASPVTLSPSTGAPNSVTIPANSSEAVISVVALGDNITEEDVVRLRLSSGASYALGSRVEADVLIYDGPEWTLVELGDPGPYPLTTSAAALNTGVLNGSSATGWSSLPQAAGMRSVNPGTGYMVTGAWWEAYVATPAQITAFEPRAISQRTPSFYHSVLAGFDGNDAIRIMDDSTGRTVLGHSVTGPSAALGINTLGTKIAGRSRKSGVDRPVYWSGTLTDPPTDLAGTILADRSGVTYALNDGDIAAGEFDMTVSGTVLRRGFRTRAGLLALDETLDGLVPPAESTPLVTSALALSANGNVVGYSFNPFTGKRALLWSGRLAGNVANPIGTGLGVWIANIGGTSDDESEATGVNSSGFIVGWSKKGSVTRAIFRRNAANSALTDPKPWIDLNDRHSVSRPTAWSLLRADAISDSAVIVGQGLKNGSPRGFMLVPRVSGN